MTMSRPIEQALLSLLPSQNSNLPPSLVELASSLLAQSRNKASTLKAEEEVARTYACANLACDRSGRNPRDQSRAHMLMGWNADSKSPSTSRLSSLARPSHRASTGASTPFLTKSCRPRPWLDAQRRMASAHRDPKASARLRLGLHHQEALQPRRSRCHSSEHLARRVPLPV